MLPPEHADRILNAKLNRPYVVVVALTVLVAQIRHKIPVRTQVEHGPNTEADS